MQKKLVALGMILLSSCTQNFATKSIPSQWDFDHHVKFVKTESSQNTFQLKIIPNINDNFEIISAFLLRESYKICGHYNYTIKVLQGIQGYDDKRTMPNYIPPSLIANIECLIVTKSE